MKTRKIAVGSLRGPKLEAVREAVEQFALLFGEGTKFEAIGFEVESGVAHTPLSAGESMRGARQRAEELVRRAESSEETFDFYVGVEGGLEVIASESGHSSGADAGRRRVFLESWAYVTDGVRGHFGRSGAIELPEALAVEVVDRKVELAAAIDAFAGAAGIRDRQGAWGILSGDLITRREAFRVAVIAGFAPFYNAGMFQATRVQAAGSASN